MKPSMSNPFAGTTPPSFSAITTIVFCIALEASMFVMFYAVYTETVGLMNETYLSELPVIGTLFSGIDPDANASHIISILLAVFSVATPIFIWAETFRQNILDDPKEWFSHPQNQIVSLIAFLVLAMVIGLEVVNLYTLVARESMPSGFVTQSQDSVMAFLAQNKGLAIGVSIVISVINIILALFTTRALSSLKASEE
ncbi:MAG: hypothetical protein ACRBCS_06580 [Cellvibrionaceae bacterium]